MCLQAACPKARRSAYLRWQRLARRAASYRRCSARAGLRHRRALGPRLRERIHALRARRRLHRSRQAPRHAASRKGAKRWCSGLGASRSIPRGMVRSVSGPTHERRAAVVRTPLGRVPRHSRARSLLAAVRAAKAARASPHRNDVAWYQLSSTCKQAAGHLRAGARDASTMLRWRARDAGRRVTAAALGSMHAHSCLASDAAAARQAGIPTGDLELPQVAVVGCQSSGKSSVLEALVRRSGPWAPACRLGFEPARLRRLAATSCRAAPRSARAGRWCCSSSTRPRSRAGRWSGESSCTALERCSPILKPSGAHAAARPRRRTAQRLTRHAAPQGGDPGRDGPRDGLQQGHFGEANPAQNQQPVRAHHDARRPARHRARARGRPARRHRGAPAALRPRCQPRKLTCSMRSCGRRASAR